MSQTLSIDYPALAQQIKTWGAALGFQQVGICDTDLSDYAKRLKAWLAKNYHGDMDWMARHVEKRCQPDQLVPGTKRIISVRMNYLPPNAKFMTLHESAQAFISRYAVGRDYHKVLRRRLQRLADKISTVIEPFGYRAFTDSAPVLEKPIAEKAGLGWIGKHTNLIHPQAGSFFFLGELFTDLPLPVDQPIADHCGSCQACIAVCPTQAIVAPYQLDARLCISYLTIELKGPIPESLRPLIGNRIYGCDDCQLACPWNKFAHPTEEEDFYARRGLSSPLLLELFQFDRATFEQRCNGSAIRRLGHERWLRNIAVALGNAPYEHAIVAALKQRRVEASPLVAEHIDWALMRQQQFKTGALQPPKPYRLATIPAKRWQAIVNPESRRRAPLNAEPNK